VASRRATVTADHVGMHAPARHGTHMGGTLRGLLAACASARLDVLVFSSASAFLAVHAAVDSFVAPEPANGAIFLCLGCKQLSRGGRSRVSLTFARCSHGASNLA
jgi:hypothetical protein